MIKGTFYALQEGSVPVIPFLIDMREVKVWRIRSKSLIVFILANTCDPMNGDKMCSLSQEVG